MSLVYPGALLSVLLYLLLNEEQYYCISRIPILSTSPSRSGQSRQSAVAAEHEVVTGRVLLLHCWNSLCMAFTTAQTSLFSWHPKEGCKIFGATLQGTSTSLILLFGEMNVRLNTTTSSQLHINFDPYCLFIFFYTKIAICLMTKKQVSDPVRSSIQTIFNREHSYLLRHPGKFAQNG